MVEITNGTQTIVVASGAFRELFKPHGWRLVDEPEIKVPDVVDTVPPIAPENDSPEKVEGEEPETDDDEAADDEEPEEGDSDAATEDSDEDILERPLSELSLDELKRVATLKGLNPEGLRSRKDIRELIRSSGK